MGSYGEGLVVGVFVGAILALAIKSAMEELDERARKAGSLAAMNVLHAARAVPVTSSQSSAELGSLIQFPQE